MNCKAAREMGAIVRAEAFVKLQNLIIATRKEDVRDGKAPRPLRELARYIKTHRHVLALPPEVVPVGVEKDSVSFWLAALQFETGRQHKATKKRTGRRRQLLEVCP